MDGIFQNFTIVGTTCASNDVVDTAVFRTARTTFTHLEVIVWSVGFVERDNYGRAYNLWRGFVSTGISCTAPTPVGLTTTFPLVPGTIRPVNVFRTGGQTLRGKGRSRGVFRGEREGNAPVPSLGGFITGVGGHTLPVWGPTLKKRSNTPRSSWTASSPSLFPFSD